MTTDELVSRTRLIDNDIKVMRSEVLRIQHDLQAQRDKIKENTEKIRVNKTLPYLVSNVIELLDVDPEELGEEDGANVDLDSQRKGEETCLLLLDLPYLVLISSCFIERRRSPNIWNLGPSQVALVKLF